MERKKIARWSILGVLAIVFPLLLVFQYSIDPTNYQEEYIQSLKPIETNELEFDKENSKVKLKEDGQLKVLQLTDVHFVGGRAGKKLDLKALKAIYKMVDHTKPDLICYTGDVLYPMRLLGSLDNIKAATIISSFFKKMEVPFLYAYGNHDTEHYATGNYRKINDIFKQNEYCYARIDRHGENAGRMTQAFHVVNYDDSLNTILFTVDSGSYVYKEALFSPYENINSVTSWWYEFKLNEIKKQYGLENTSDIQSFIFSHIPLYEYKEAANKYREGSSEVTYIFGENHEAISSPKSPSGFFELITNLKSTKAMFFGHDHKNSLCLKYKGVEFYPSYSIDYRAYPTIRFTDKYRGGVVITINSDKAYSVEHILLKDIENE